MRISLEQALDILMDHVTQGRTERKPLEQCLGLVLSQDVFALLDMPPFSRSAQDGYALCSKDSVGVDAENPVKLKVTGKIYAGDAVKDLKDSDSFVFLSGYTGQIRRGGPHYDRRYDTCRC